MPPIVNRRAASAESLLSDIRPGMAKVHSSAVRNPDGVPLFAELGTCIDEVRCEFRLTLEAFAHELGKDDRQVARWISGEVRPQLEAVFAVERFRAPLVIALAKLAKNIDVTTTITVRRIA
jgi:hypothetical protein